MRSSFHRVSRELSQHTTPASQNSKYDRVVRLREVSLSVRTGQGVWAHSRGRYKYGRNPNRVDYAEGERSLMRPACEGTGPTGQGRRVATKAALGTGSIIGANREIIQKTKDES